MYVTGRSRHLRPYKVYIHTYLAQTPEIGQGLGRFLSCGACKQEQTWTTLFHDKLILP